MPAAGTFGRCAMGSRVTRCYASRRYSTQRQVPKRAVTSRDSTNKTNKQAVEKVTTGISRAAMRWNWNRHCEPISSASTSAARAASAERPCWPACQMS
jgi:hypothetical protein